MLHIFTLNFFLLLYIYNFSIFIVATGHFVDMAFDVTSFIIDGRKIRNMVFLPLKLFH